MGWVKKPSCPCSMVARKHQFECPTCIDWMAACYKVPFLTIKTISPLKLLRASSNSQNHNNVGGDSIIPWEKIYFWMRFWVVVLSGSTNTKVSKIDACALSRLEALYISYLMFPFWSRNVITIPVSLMLQGQQHVTLLQQHIPGRVKQWR